MFRRQIRLYIFLLLGITVCSCTFNSSPESANPAVSAATPKSPFPKDGSSNQSVFPTLTWDGGSAVSYEIYISQANPPQIKAGTSTLKSFDTSLLTPNTKYYWQVVALSGDGSKIAGPVWSFTTTAATPGPGSGYAMSLSMLTASQPHNISAVFQVTDLNLTGIGTLKGTDFDVYEDYQSISKSESNLIIANRPTVPNTIRTILLLDNSSSVQNDLNNIRQSARLILNGMLPNQQFAVYQFSDATYLLQDYTNDMNLLLDAVNNKFQGGVSTTDFNGAVVRASALLQTQYSYTRIEQGALIIISDGSDTKGTTPFSAALDAVRGRVVYTLAVGASSEIQLPILNSIGVSGSFSMGQESALISQEGSLSASVINYANSFYDLTYNSPKRGSGSHSLEIMVLNNPYTGNRSAAIGVFSSADFY